MLLHMYYQQANTTITKQILVRTYALLTSQYLDKYWLMNQYCCHLDKLTVHQPIFV